MTPHDFMSRKIIELHNFDKYQPYFHAPLVDRIEGDAEEIILSGDGRDTSASGNTPGSLSMNVSGGVWIDYLVATTQQFAVSGALTSSNAENIFTFNSNTYPACFIDLLVSRGGSRFAEHTVVVTDPSGTTFERTGTHASQYSYSAVTASGNTTIKLTGQINDTYRAVIKLL